jgi:predicted nucleic acid-binding protein
LILSFDLRRALRRLKPDHRLDPIAPRPPSDLPFIDPDRLPGAQLLLDTTVYIDALQDRAPAEVEETVSSRICNHSAVCFAELTHAFGRLDPAHADTASALAWVEEAISAIRPHRLFEPSAAVWGVAGILAGLAFRLGGYAKGHERRRLNDALVYLQGVELGAVVLTRNIADFDRLNQLVPEGRILFYRESATA